MGVSAGERPRERGAAFTGTIALLIAFVGPAAAGPSPSPLDSPAGAAAPSGTVAVDAVELARNPGRWTGRRVVVRAEVQRVFEPHALTVAGPKPGPGIFVLNPAPADAVDPRATITVVGTVRPFVAADLAREHAWFRSGWFGDDPAAAPQATVVAESMRTTTGIELVRSP
jgi:hypothetical protein